MNFQTVFPLKEKSGNVDSQRTVHILVFRHASAVQENGGFVDQSLKNKNMFPPFREAARKGAGIDPGVFADPFALKKMIADGRIGNDPMFHQGQEDIPRNIGFDFPDSALLFRFEVPYPVQVQHSFSPGFCCRIRPFPVWLSSRIVLPFRGYYIFVPGTRQPRADSFLFMKIGNDFEIRQRDRCTPLRFPWKVGNGAFRETLIAGTCGGSSPESSRSISGTPCRSAAGRKIRRFPFRSVCFPQEGGRHVRSGSV